MGAQSAHGRAVTLVCTHAMHYRALLTLTAADRQQLSTATYFRNGRIQARALKEVVASY